VGDSRQGSVPIIVSLPKIDFWYWCRHFVDVSRECPYGCSYCNTQKRRERKEDGCAFGPSEEGPRAETGAAAEGEMRLLRVSVWKRAYRRKGSDRSRPSERALSAGRRRRRIGFLCSQEPLRRG